LTVALKPAVREEHSAVTERPGSGEWNVKY
jgi:hypothetical protein